MMSLGGDRSINAYQTKSVRLTPIQTSLFCGLLDCEYHDGLDASPANGAAVRSTGHAAVWAWGSGSRSACCTGEGD